MAREMLPRRANWSFPSHLKHALFLSPLSYPRRCPHRHPHSGRVHVTDPPFQSHLRSRRLLCVADRRLTLGHSCCLKHCLVPEPRGPGHRGGLLTWRCPFKWALARHWLERGMNSFAISQHRQAASLKKEADSVSTLHRRGGRNLPAQGYWSAGVWLRDGKDGLAGGGCAAHHLGGRCMGVRGRLPTERRQPPGHSHSPGLRKRWWGCF